MMCPMCEREDCCGLNCPAAKKLDEWPSAVKPTKRLGKVRSYYESMGIPTPNEQVATQWLIESHQRMRKAQLWRDEHWKALPQWKKALATWLGLKR